MIAAAKILQELKPGEPDADASRINKVVGCKIAEMHLASRTDEVARKVRREVQGLRRTEAGG